MAKARKRPEGPRPDRWAPFERDVERFVRKVLKEDALPEADIDAAEARLGFRLPGALREYYLRFGAPSEINNGCDELVAPADLAVDDGQLVFYRAHQGTLVWGTPAHGGDAATAQVFCAVNDAARKWELFFDDAVEFFRWMLCNQLVTGYRFVAYEEASTDAGFDRLAGKLKSSLDEVRFAGAHHPPFAAARFFAADRGLVGLLGRTTVGVMGQTAAAVGRIVRKLGIGASMLSEPDRRTPEAYARAFIEENRATAAYERERERKRREEAARPRPNWERVLYRLAENNERCVVFFAMMRTTGLACPYCGTVSRSHEPCTNGTSGRKRFECGACKGLFDAGDLDAERAGPLPVRLPG